MSRMSAFCNIALERASFMRHPPLSVVTGSAIIFLEKPTFSIISATSSLVDPQAWMRLRREGRETRAARDVRSTTLRETPSTRTIETDAGNATGR